MEMQDILSRARNSQRQFRDVLEDRVNIMSEITPEAVERYVHQLKISDHTPAQQFEILLGAYTTLEEWWLMRVVGAINPSPFFLDHHAQQTLRGRLYSVTELFIARMTELVKKEGVPCAHKLCATGRVGSFCKLCGKYLC